MASFSAARVSATISCPTPVPRIPQRLVDRNILFPSILLGQVQRRSSQHGGTNASHLIRKIPNALFFCTRIITYTNLNLLNRSPTSPQKTQFLKQFLISEGPVLGQSLTSESVCHHVHQRRRFTLQKKHPGPGRDPYGCFTSSHCSSVQHTSLLKLKVRTVYHC